MKTYLIILFSFISLTFSFAQERIPGDPIPGADVKVGRKPPGGNIAFGTTGVDGTYEFKNLPPGKGYFVTVDFGIKEKGIKSKSRTIEITDIEILKSGVTKYKGQVGDPHEITGDGMKSMTKDSTTIVTVIAGNGTIKVKHDTVKNSINNIR